MGDIDVLQNRPHPVTVFGEVSNAFFRVAQFSAQPRVVKVC
jgi:hypothetical protein